MELLPMSKKGLSRVEVLERMKAKKMTQKKGAETLGLSVRQVRRLQKKYAEKGAAGLIHRVVENRATIACQQRQSGRRSISCTVSTQILVQHSPMKN